MRFLLPVLLALLGLAGGAGAGYMLRPGEPAAELQAACGEAGGEASAENGNGAGAAPEEPVLDAEGEPTRDFVKLNNQFVVPVVEGGAVAALVILSLTLEVALGSSEQVYAFEPKLRDEFLQVLFDHANAGGFDGAFTGSNNMDVLRLALLEAARKSLADTVTDVLIVDIVRQDA